MRSSAQLRRLQSRVGLTQNDLYERGIVVPSRPVIFFDTSVCIDVARGKIPPSEWTSAWKVISSTYRYRISPFTAYELLAGLATGDDARFDESRQPLRVLYASGPKKVLPVLRVFFAKQLFNDNVPSNPEVPDINRMLKC